MVSEGSELIGFLPFSAGRMRTATGIASRLTNCQAFVCDPAAPVPIDEVLLAAGIDLFEFHALLPPKRSSTRGRGDRVDALAIDVSEGFEHYLAGARAHRPVREIKRKRRRLQRDYGGELRFEFADADSGNLAQLVRWKSAQSRRTGRPDWLAWRGIPELVERLAASRAEAMTGCLSALSIGERIIALDLDLRSRTTLAGWLTSFDTELASWSPGVIMMVSLIEGAAAAGIRTIDLATGDEQFKRKLANTTVPLLRGWVGRPSVGLVVQRSRHAPAEFTHRFIVSHPTLRRVARDALRRYGKLRTRSEPRLASR